MISTLLILAVNYCDLQKLVTVCFLLYFTMLLSSVCLYTVFISVYVSLKGCQQRRGGKHAVNTSTSSMSLLAVYFCSSYCVNFWDLLTVCRCLQYNMSLDGTTFVIKLIRKGVNPGEFHVVRHTCRFLFPKV